MAKVSEVLVQMLEQACVNRLYGVGGDSLNVMTQYMSLKTIIKEGAMSRSHIGRVRFTLGMATVIVAAVSGGKAYAQANPNSQPNPYRTVANWAKLPEGRTIGQTAGLAIDRDGKSVWDFERCGGASCAGSNLAPILEFDPSGRVVKSFGAGMFLLPHGIFVDKKNGNVWATDARGEGGKGQQVFKFSPDGKLLMTLGKAGIAGEGPDTFNQPSAVLVAPNGNIFVADGHGPTSNAQIVKFSADGKFIKAWGKHGKGPGEFEFPHSLAMASTGRMFVADRGNNRIQIFDQDGTFLEEWPQFGRPSGIFIDKKDVLYSADSESNAVRNPGFKRGIRIGSARDGKVTAFIPDPVLNPGQGMDPLDPANGTGAEGVAADDAGNIYGAEVFTHALKKYAKNPLNALKTQATHFQRQETDSPNTIRLFCSDGCETARPHLSAFEEFRKVLSETQADER